MENEASAGEAAFFAADNLKAGGIAHGFFLRTGGVSEGILRLAELRARLGRRQRPR